MGSLAIWALVSVCLVFGFLGCFINKIPGPIAVLVAMLIAMFGLHLKFGWGSVAIVAVLTIGSMFLPKVLKSAANKVQEYSKRASRGTTIGSILGLLLIMATAKKGNVSILVIMAVIGLVIIPFVLAFLLELSNKDGNGTAMKRATAATTVYVADTLLKLLVFVYAFYAMFYIR